MINDQDLNLVRQRATVIHQIAARHGWAMPDEERAARALAAAAKTIASEPGERPKPLPTDLKKLNAWVAAEVDRRFADGGRRTVATEVAQDADRDSIRLALGEAPGFAGKLIAEFNADAVEFNQLVGTTIHEPTGNSTAAEAAAHVKLLNVRDRLIQSAYDRLTLVPLLEEDAVIDAAWLVIDPVPSTSMMQLRDFIASLDHGLPATLAEWAQAAGIGLSMAGSNVAARRVNQHGEANYAGGHGTPDGGRADRTFGEALALVGAGAAPSIQERRPTQW